MTSFLLLQSWTHLSIFVVQLTCKTACPQPSREGLHEKLGEGKAAICLASSASDTAPLGAASQCQEDDTVVQVAVFPLAGGMTFQGDGRRGGQSQGCGDCGRLCHWIQWSLPSREVLHGPPNLCTHSIAGTAPRRALGAARSPSNKCSLPLRRPWRLSLPQDSGGHFTAGHIW